MYGIGEQYGKYRGVNWSPEETLTLIDLWEEQEVKYHVSEMRQNQEHFQVIGQRLESMYGVRRSADQVRFKVKNLKRAYYKTQREMAAGQTVCRFKLFDRLHRFMANLPYPSNGVPRPGHLPGTAAPGSLLAGTQPPETGIPQGPCIPQGPGQRYPHPEPFPLDQQIPTVQSVTGQIFRAVPGMNRSMGIKLEPVEHFEDEDGNCGGNIIPSNPEDGCHSNELPDDHDLSIGDTETDHLSISDSLALYGNHDNDHTTPDSGREEEEEEEEGEKSGHGDADGNSPILPENPVCPSQNSEDRATQRKRRPETDYRREENQIETSERKRPRVSMETRRPPAPCSHCQQRHEPSIADYLEKFLVMGNRWVELYLKAEEERHRRELAAEERRIQAEQHFRLQMMEMQGRMFSAMVEAVNKGSNVNFHGNHANFGHYGPMNNNDAGIYADKGHRNNKAGFQGDRNYKIQDNNVASDNAKLTETTRTSVNGITARDDAGNNDTIMISQDKA